MSVLLWTRLNRQAPAPESSAQRLIRAVAVLGLRVQRFRMVLLSFSSPPVSSPAPSCELTPWISTVRIPSGLGAPIGATYHKHGSFFSSTFVYLSPAMNCRHCRTALPTHTFVDHLSYSRSW